MTMSWRLLFLLAFLMASMVVLLALLAQEGRLADLVCAEPVEVCEASP